MRNKLVLIEDGKVCELQPDAPITQIAKMVEWAMSALDVGKYDLVREVPGVLEVTKQQRTVCKFKQEKK